MRGTRKTFVVAVTLVGLGLGPWPGTIALAAQDPAVEFSEDCSIGLHELTITPRGDQPVTVQVSLGVAPAFELVIASSDSPYVASVPQGGDGSGSVHVVPQGDTPYQIAAWQASQCIPPLPDGWLLDLIPFLCEEEPCPTSEESYPAGETFYIEEGLVIDDNTELAAFVDPSTGFDLYIDGVLVDAPDVVISDFPVFIKFSVHDFPGGLSGSHHIYGEWWEDGVLTGTAELNAQFGTSGTFIDDNGHIFENAIEWLADEGITKGCNPPANTKFCPNDFVTRGQMAAFLVRALDLTDTLDDPFSDDDDSIFEADIEKLAAAGITKGCNPPTNDRFCPDSKVTREQMAAFLVRAIGYVDDGGGNLFIDDDDSIFEDDIDKLGTAGVTKGCNPPVNDKYCPGSVVTRGQMAAFLHRALG